MNYENISKIVIKRLKKEIKHSPPEGIMIAEVRDVAALCYLSEHAVPSIDLLQSRLETGCKIAYQDKNWWLFDADGEGIVCGKTLRELLMELIFAADEKLESYLLEEKS